MKKMKKMIVGFAAVALIVGGSAFTSISTKKVPTVFYALNEAGTQYVKTTSDQTAFCNPDATLDRCVIGYEAGNAPSETILPVNSHPTADYESPSNGWAQE
ncbi:MAG: hypothetical protein EOO45_03160 [Flavobacterium sp.]|nr:MAG: hypothetical protein EOO45_03160 [Flavobacterium sp.]